MTSLPPRITANQIGEYIQRQCCERRFKLEMNDHALAKELPFFSQTLSSIDPVLQSIGEEREERWTDELSSSGMGRISPLPSEKVRVGIEWRDFVEELERRALQDHPLFAHEVALEGRIGAFLVEGRLDYVLLVWREGRPRLRLVECKASRKDKTYHRIQLAIYLALVRNRLSAGPIRVAGHILGPEDVETVVVRVDDETNRNQSIIAADPLDLRTESDDVLHLLHPGGALHRVHSSDLGQLPYHLDGKCDECVFSSNCLPESALGHRLEILGLDLSTVKALRENGLRTVDDLARLDHRSDGARRILSAPGFQWDLEALILKAKVRQGNLPGVMGREFEVCALPHPGKGQLPPHESEGSRLVRVYLVVETDYTANRIGALSAHVTMSGRRLTTPFHRTPMGGWRPLPRIAELENGDESSCVPVSGMDLVRFREVPWSGDEDEDHDSELRMLAGFLEELVEAIRYVAGERLAPVHFYTWSQQEMKDLMNACKRAGGGTLDFITELLGCRESLEQLMFSSVGDEVHSRYATSWTGTGMVVAASLSWFGSSFHWSRMVAGREVRLDKVFEHGLFDFKGELWVTDKGQWARNDDQGARRTRFEVHARFHDGLPAPYWYAAWGMLRKLRSPKYDPLHARAIERFERASDPRLLREYLLARAHALRWLEERIQGKNRDIMKSSLDLDRLRDFRLGDASVVTASIDFLRLDHHVQMYQWMSRCLVPPASRVPLGDTLPLREVFYRDRQIEARLDPDRFGMSTQELRAVCALGIDSFVRLSPCSGDPYEGQSLREILFEGKTCKVNVLDFETGLVQMELITTNRSSRYVLASSEPRANGPLFRFATIDPSASDYVANRVDGKLSKHPTKYAPAWLDPTGPRIEPKPAPGEEMGRLRAMVSSARFTSHSLGREQVDACLEGLTARFQLLLGPPGTGKTRTAAASVLMRSVRLGRGKVIFVSGPTNRALEELMDDVRGMEMGMREAATSVGLEWPGLTTLLVKDDLRDSHDLLMDALGDGTLVVGGTVNDLLRLCQGLSGTELGEDNHGFQADALVLDEASMMVFPHFLALATLVKEGGEIMLAGDNKQLSPIVAHDWEGEDRPRVGRFEPQRSAYEALRNLSLHEDVTPAMICRSALSYSYRLPFEVRKLIADKYLEEEILLDGRGMRERSGGHCEDAMDVIWQGEGVYLVLHQEKGSARSNAFEAKLLQMLLEKAKDLPDRSVAVITPHRAQRGLLNSMLDRFKPAVDIVDTVERIQGGERDTVLVSGTQSDPSSIAGSADFILDGNRTNVIFSRAKRRLVVVCAETLLNSLPSDLEQYRSAFLWKRLHAACTTEVASTVIEGHGVRVLVPSDEFLLSAGGVLRQERDG